MYIMLSTQPDLAYAVGKLSHFSSNPSPEHICAVNCTFSYLQDISDSALIYQQNPDDLPKPVFRYTNADWAGETNTGRSTTGYVFFLSGAAFLWASKKQEVTAGSTMEAKYITLYHGRHQAAWINYFLEQISFLLNNPLEMKCNNEAAITVANGELLHKQVKHMNVKFHTIQDYINQNLVKVTKVASEDNLTNQFTKVLPCQCFMDRTGLLGFRTHILFLLTL